MPSSASTGAGGTEICSYIGDSGSSLGLSSSLSSGPTRTVTLRVDGFDFGNQVRCGEIDSDGDWPAAGLFVGDSGSILRMKRPQPPKREIFLRCWGWYWLIWLWIRGGAEGSTYSLRVSIGCPEVNR